VDDAQRRCKIGAALGPLESAAPISRPVPNESRRSGLHYLNKLWPWVGAIERNSKIPSHVLRSAHSLTRIEVSRCWFYSLHIRNRKKEAAIEGGLGGDQTGVCVQVSSWGLSLYKVLTPAPFLLSCRWIAATSGGYCFLLVSDLRCLPTVMKQAFKTGKPPRRLDPRSLGINFARRVSCLLRHAEFSPRVSRFGWRGGAASRQWRPFLCCTSYSYNEWNEPRTTAASNWTIWIL